MEIRNAGVSLDSERIIRSFNFLIAKCRGLKTIKFNLDEDRPSVIYDPNQKAFNIPPESFKSVVNYKDKLVLQSENLKVKFHHSINFGLISESQEAAEFYVGELKKEFPEYSHCVEDFMEHHSFKKSSDFSETFKWKLHIKLFYCDEH